MKLADVIDNLTKLLASVDKKSFVYDFLAAFGTPKATLARLKSGNLNVAKKPGCILLKGKVYFEPVIKELIKTPSPREIVELATANPQIERNKPRFLFSTDFKEFVAYDTKRKEWLEVAFKELGEHYTFFLPLAGMEKTSFQEETDADVKAAEQMAKLYDIIIADNPPSSKTERHQLNVFLTRLLFCLFAEDTGIFPDRLFTNAIKSFTQSDGSDVGELLQDIFLVLNTQPESRKKIKPHLSEFPYVNGGLFSDTIGKKLVAPQFTTKSRLKLIDLGGKSWKEINPDIFGSMFQGVVDEEKRAELGMHYTSVPNIMKVIRPLFLDDLYAEFEKSKGSDAKLSKLLSHIYRLRIFDPACGSGNFLIIAYKELRRLEMAVFQELQRMAVQLPLALSGIQVSQFCGIELDDFAHEVAILALWLAEHQMNIEFEAVFGKAPASLPLKDPAKIICGNALQLDWKIVCPNDEGCIVFVLGNPPYSGSRKQTDLQKEDMALVFKKRDGYKNIDFIACWFELAASYVRGNKCRAAFVSTNSICQGVQTAIIWPEILAKGVEIKFAYAPFKWVNNAKSKAGVTCVIIGLGSQEPSEKRLFSHGLARLVHNINPYLAPGNNTIVRRRASTISELPAMFFGNMPNDGGHLIFDERPTNFFPEDPVFSQSIVRRYMGADEFLQNQSRYCLWIQEHQLKRAQSHDVIKKRLNGVTEHRNKSTEPSTRKKAKTPHEFYFNRHTDSPLILFPSTTSESRDYIPVGMFFDNPIVSNSAMVVYEAEPWLFAVVSSKIHMVWIRAVAGGLETRIRYSSSICYNTFPFPRLSAAQKKKLNQLAESVLKARERHHEKTIAWLYDPETMPPDLLAFHRALDEAVELCYRAKAFTSDEERLEYLFALYERMAGVEVRSDQSSHLDIIN